MCVHHVRAGGQQACQAGWVRARVRACAHRHLVRIGGLPPAAPLRRAPIGGQCARPAGRRCCAATAVARRGSAASGARSHAAPPRLAQARPPRSAAARALLVARRLRTPRTAPAAVRVAPARLRRRLSPVLRGRGAAMPEARRCASASRSQAQRGGTRGARAAREARWTYALRSRPGAPCSVTCMPDASRVVCRLGQHLLVRVVRCMPRCITLCYCRC